MIPIAVGQCRNNLIKTPLLCILQAMNNLLPAAGGISPNTERIRQHSQPTAHE